MKLINISTPKYPNTFTKVDDDIFNLLNQWKWHKMSNGYCARAISKNGKIKFILMHRYITKATKGLEVDHINRNKLDNQKSNLRLVSSAENKVAIPMLKTNTSGLKGVTWDKRAKKWKAQISFNNKNRFIGNFDIKIEAGIAYNKVARQLFGEIAQINRIGI